MQSGYRQVAICLSPLKVLEEHLHDQDFLIGGICNDFLLNDYCFSVLGHAVACILQLDACVLLVFLIIFWSLFEASRVSLPQQLYLSRSEVCIQLERKYSSALVYIMEICMNLQIRICLKLRTVAPDTFVVLTVTWTLIDHFSLNKSFAVNITETWLFICYTGLCLTKTL